MEDNEEEGDSPTGPEGGAGSETAEGTAAPDTGTMTMQGSSAMSAGIMAAVAVAVLASIAGFAYLVRRD